MKRIEITTCQPERGTDWRTDSFAV